MNSSDICPCGGPMDYLNCCGRYIEKGAYPQTAELLMKSRYTAYCSANTAYLTKTWHPDHCPQLQAEDIKKTQWCGLEILNTQPGLKKSIVEFKASYREGGNVQVLHEVSEFKKIKNRWVYLKAANF